MSANTGYVQFAPICGREAGLCPVRALHNDQKWAPMKFRPLHDRVVIKRIEQEAKTKGGIISPDNAKEKPQEGEVIAVGPGGRDESGKLTPIDLKGGDRILFRKWSGTEIKLGGEELLIMKESDVMGVVQSQAATNRPAPARKKA